MVSKATSLMLLLSFFAVITAEYAEKEDYTLEIDQKLGSNAAGCSMYRCKKSSQTFSSNVCSWYDKNYDIYYVQTCLESQTCTAGTKAGENYTCITTPTTKLQAYPGEKCSTAADCVNSVGCTNGICEGTATGSACTTSAQCIPGDSCQKVAGTDVCTELIPVGKTGCANDYDCAYNAGCNIVSATTLTDNTCVEYLSLTPGSQVQELSCVGNYTNLCSSGYCAKTGTGTTAQYLCTDELKSNHSLPWKCYSTESEACVSNVDTHTGLYAISTCSCSFSPHGDAYCKPLLGDTPYKRLTQQNYKWVTSKYVSSCNTERRLWPSNLNCIQDYWTDTEAATMIYYGYALSSYTEIQGAEDCVMNVFEYEYLAAKKAYGKDEAAREITLAVALLISLIA
ncbi:unnamed protein product [Blepharisma stoltei]|uniref:Uncharacterized protein n=1 Tax=Blepharisma stoltei TaxID=1481888 RepID=A0AAU9JT68_9CILI|nr:unnamed protein product [Blepharisma stoltei]